MPALPRPSFKLADAYPALAPVEGWVASRDWPSIRRLFDGLTQGGPGWLTSLVVGGPRSEALLRGVLDRDPQEPVANLMLARLLINRGWEIRGGGRASTVSAEQFAAFHDHLRRAEVMLIDVTARYPTLAYAWQVRLITSRALQLTTAETRRRYDRANQLSPHNFGLQSAMLQDLCRKWGGSDEEMFAFARECAGAAPEGSLCGALVAEAHVEKWLDTNDRDERKAYVHGEAVREELYRVAHRSIWHPAFGRDYSWVDAVSEFALIFSLAEDFRAAAHCFRLMGPVGSTRDWGYLGGGTEEANFVKYRDLAFEKESAR